VVRASEEDGPQRKTMDATSISPVGKGTRDRLAEYRDENDLPNYDEALWALLDGEGG
jgi:hypothetical protein